MNHWAMQLWKLSLKRESVGQLNKFKLQLLSNFQRTHSLTEN